MDMKNFLDQMLQSGKDIAQKGQTMAEEKLGVPAEVNNETRCWLA